MLKNLFKKKTKPFDQLSSFNLEHFLIDAIEALELKDYEEAVKRFSLLVEAYPEHPLAHLMLGRSHLEMRHFPQAIEEFYKHINVVPTSVEAMIYLGLAYFECNEFALAQARFEEAMKLRASSLARENLLITKISAGRLDDALNDLIALNKDNPADKDVLELLVLTLGKMGKWEAAKQYVQKNISGSEVVVPA